jgi:hypothetical protein
VREEDAPDGKQNGKPVIKTKATPASADANELQFVWEALIEESRCETQQQLHA